jgi:CheY-like chemotaxis protein
MPKLLLVEDNEANWDMLSRRLRRRGYDVVIAEDGQRGIDLARSEQPDLVLMDVDLPVVDGLEATRTLRDDPDGDRLPIIALTAHALNDDRDRALKAGCNDYHAKPIEFSKLLDQIEALLPSSS